MQCNNSKAADTIQGRHRTKYDRHVYTHKGFGIAGSGEQKIHTHKKRSGVTSFNKSASPKLRNNLPDRIHKVKSIEGYKVPVKDPFLLRILAWFFPPSLTLSIVANCHGQAFHRLCVCQLSRNPSSHFCKSASQLFFENKQVHSQTNK